MYFVLLRSLRPIIESFYCTCGAITSTELFWPGATLAIEICHQAPMMGVTVVVRCVNSFLLISLRSNIKGVLYFCDVLSPVVKWLLTILGCVLWPRLQGGWRSGPQQRMRFSQTVNVGHGKADASSTRKNERRRRRGIAWWRNPTTCRWDFSSPKTRSPDLLAHEKEVQACPAIMEKVNFNSWTIRK